MLALTRVVMNPGDSRTSTVSFPIRRETSSIASSVAGALSSARTISTSFILWTGLKKCMPATREGFFSDPASSVMLSADVFEPMTACGRRVLLDLGEQRQLEVDPLGRRFDDEIRVVQRLGQARGGRQPRQHGVGVRGRQLAELDPLLDDLLDRAAPLADRLVGHVVHPRRVAAGDRRMRDPVPHRPRAEHRDSRFIYTRRSASRRRSDDLAQRRHRVIDLRLGVVEVRRHADAGAGPVVDDDPAADQLVGDRHAVRHVDDDRPAALVIGGGRVEAVAGGHAPRP